MTRKKPTGDNSIVPISSCQALCIDDVIATRLTQIYAFLSNRPCKIALASSFHHMQTISQVFTFAICINVFFKIFVINDKDYLHLA